MYFAPAQGLTEEHIYSGPIIPLLFSYGLYEWKAGAKGRYNKLDYAPFAPPEYIYDNVQVDERGAGAGAFGNGTGVSVPWPVGRGYYEIGMTGFRDFFIDVVLGELAGREEGLRFSVPPQVEVRSRGTPPARRWCT